MSRLPGLLVIMTLGLAPAKAQLDPGLVQSANNQIANASAAALEVFSAANTISAGNFHYDNDGPDDVDFSTLKLPLDYKFGPVTNRLRPFVEGYLGYFELKQDVSIFGPPTGEYKNYGFTLSAGGGVEWRICDWLYVSPRLLLAYTHLWQDYSRDDPPGDPYANVITDWKADALAVIPSLEAKTPWVFGRWDLQLKSRYTFIQLLGLHESVDYIDLDSASQVWKNEIGISYRSPWTLFHLPLRPFAQFARYDLAGEIVAADLGDYFYEGRAGIGFSMPKGLKPLTELVLSGAYFFGGDLSGYSVGVQLAF